MDNYVPPADREAIDFAREIETVLGVTVQTLVRALSILASSPTDARRAATAARALADMAEQLLTACEHAIERKRLLKKPPAHDIACLLAAQIESSRAARLSRAMDALTDAGADGESPS